MATHFSLMLIQKPILSDTLTNHDLTWPPVFSLSLSQRKVRRDMLASPVVERGRSRSREAYPQLTRAGSGSRGRSLSMESRRSRQSSVNSLVELDELTSG